MNRRYQPIRLRYTAQIQLDNGCWVGIPFDYLKDAVGFASRIVAPGEWWEVIDNMTKNTIMSARTQE